MVLFLCNTANAGFNALTIHSRANCANNESISWHFNHNYNLFTTSDHIDGRTGTVVHSVATGWQYTWRSAAIHWGEGRGGWVVHGYHWIKDESGRVICLGEETVSDCSIYDGWWDQQH